MPLSDFIAGGGLSLFVIFTLIQIAPIKINPWSWIGEALTKDISEKVEKLENQVDALSNTVEEQMAIAARVRILRFGDEVMHKKRHSKDHFDSILRDVALYEKYCNDHPDFKNGITEPTVEIIRVNYRERLEKGDFL